MSKTHGFNVRTFLLYYYIFILFIFLLVPKPVKVEVPVQVPFPVEVPIEVPVPVEKHIPVRKYLQQYILFFFILRTQQYSHFSSWLSVLTTTCVIFLYTSYTTIFRKIPTLHMGLNCRICNLYHERF